MKILVIQLARLGDIFISWPALRALKRTHPEAEIHVLTRPKFASALVGLNVVDKIHHLPSREILAPLVQLNLDVQEAFQRMDSFVQVLTAEKYDWIVNQTFSPFSSYLTHAITHPETKVVGYSRFSDGYLAIPDDMSAYFYAQVGVGRANRFHLTEIFASQMGLDLIESDWAGPDLMPVPKQELPEEYFVLHVGASEATKALQANDWALIIRQLHQYYPISCVLIGAPGEKNIAEAIAQHVESIRLVNLVGETNIQDLFPIIKNAEALLGCDSAPMHIASLVKTPCLNISFPAVNFWETGPRAPGSFVIKFADLNSVQHDKVGKALYRMITGDKQDIGIIPVQPGAPSYWALTTKQSDFEWHLLKALYIGDDFPSTEDNTVFEGIQKLDEMNKIMIDQMKFVTGGGDLLKVSPIIERGEEVIEAIGKLVPSLKVLIKWYQTEKIRIAPADQKQILARTLEIHELLQKVLELYIAHPSEAGRELE
ncbi:MAG: hypothetical protein BroJett040_05370 [Oligoflexia bacterium]|nr:MAG: hypothetical protein BroJett040_05370 [Oligoflexia bacterium]